MVRRVASQTTLVPAVNAFRAARERAIREDAVRLYLRLPYLAQFFVREYLGRNMSRVVRRVGRAAPASVRAAMRPDARWHRPPIRIPRPLPPPPLMFNGVPQPRVPLLLPPPPGPRAGDPPPAGPGVLQLRPRGNYRSG